MSVDSVVNGPVEGVVVQAHTICGDVRLRSSRGDLVVPRQLPAAPGYFTGRTGELAALTSTLDEHAGHGGTVVISAIAGAGGIGKTWLALHWAHQHVDRFPDGQLFVNLRGFDPSGHPLPPETAVRGFLDALGVDPQSIPVDFDAQVGRYRSLVAGKRMLIVLDNARDTSHVLPLLPGSPTCTVLVTSRDRLPALATTQDSKQVRLDVLTEDEAHELLVHRLGTHRTAAEPAAVAALLACCAGLPLAVAIVAGQAREHPRFPLSVLADQLHDAATRLGVLDADDPAASLPAVLSWSFAALTAEQARVFALLGLVPSPDISLPAVANLAGLPTAQTRAVLRELERVSVVEQHVPDRYRMHDLVRLYAAGQARHLPEDTRTAGLRRLADFYLHTALTSSRLLFPHGESIEFARPVPGCHVLALQDRKAARAWFDAEHSCLLAIHRLVAEQEWHSAVWQIAWALTTYQYRQGHLHADVTAWEAGLDAADHLGDPFLRTRAHRLLARAHSRTDRPGKALDHLQQALGIAEDIGDTVNRARTHLGFALVLGRQAKDQQALDHATLALQLYQLLDQPMWEAWGLNVAGWFHARLGHLEQALTYCQAALALCHRSSDPDSEADTLDSLGYIAHRGGRYMQALGHYLQALILRHHLGHAYFEGDTLERLGTTEAALNRHLEAHQTWLDVLERYHTQDRMLDAERVQFRLDQRSTVVNGQDNPRRHPTAPAAGIH